MFHGILWGASIVGTIAKWWGFLSTVSWWLIWTPAFVSIAILILVLVVVGGMSVKYFG